ncbi:MAG: hypothetical protein JHC95_12525 [Solirubrobacteraceae bacterium]|nr:hypothetical protein [Solirubrobacteraceae bacterium]
MTIRHAGADDAPAVATVQRLAVLDSSATPPAPYLIAEVGGVAVAARSLKTGEVVADPFTRTAELVPMLHMRAEQLGRAPRVAVAPARRFGLRAI